MGDRVVTMAQRARISGVGGMDGVIMGGSWRLEVGNQGFGAGGGLRM